MTKHRNRKLTTLLALATIAFGACSDDPTEPTLTPPTVAAAAQGQARIVVTITPVAGATSYNIERATGAAGGTFAQVGTTATTTFEDTNVEAATTYRYRVAAVQGTRVSTFSTEVVATTAVAGPKVATITGDILANRTLFADTVYTLSGFVHVANGATLTIQPGTKILGDHAVLGSSLFVLRGAKIIANGTATAPIVFTSARAVGSRQPGDWGGLIIVGNGRINRSGTVAVEGTGTTTGTTAGTNYTVNYSGGTDNADNSGSLQYVRVEFAGFAPSDANELNSFTFAAVGSGTVLNNLQVLAGLDDSFEWFGGAVDAKYLVSYESGDDHFDMSEGYSGRLKYLIGYQTKVLIPRSGAGTVSGDPTGIENDGCNGTGCDVGHNSSPLTLPVVANFTLIGRGDATNPSASGDYGMVLRRGTGGHYVNGVLGRWVRGAIGVRDAATQQRITDGDLSINSILISEAPVIFQTGQQVGVDAAANSLILSSATTASLFASVPTLPTSEAQIDWTPSLTSAARTGGMAAFTGQLQTRAGTFITPTGYRGAVDPNAATKWWAGWTYYAQN
ncbi:MAG: hypothetical protein ACT4O1_18270 [Gemmatimonadota bacterium]